MHLRFSNNFYLRSEGVVGLYNHKHVIYEKIQMRNWTQLQKVVKIIMLNFIHKNEITTIPSNMYSNKFI
jgi:hypothetical protein